METSGDKAYSLVQAQYGNYAKLNEGSDEKVRTYHERVASAFGYSVDELINLPENSNLGISCGNPTAIANLKPGEKMIDMGSGAGLDVFIAARKVGPTGKVIGIDMTQEMLDLATRNATKSGYTNVEFVKSYIHSTPSLHDETADVITSNCVINLLPTSQKEEFFAEAYRLLKPGGRVAISDILAKKKLPEEIRTNAVLYIGCIGNASEVVEYETWLKGAGFEDILILDTNKDLNIYKEGILDPQDLDSTNRSNCCNPQPKPTVTGCCGITLNKTDTRLSEADKIENYDFNQWVGAFQIYAVKPMKAYST